MTTNDSTADPAGPPGTGTPRPTLGTPRRTWVSGGVVLLVLVALAAAGVVAWALSTDSETDPAAGGTPSPITSPSEPTTPGGSPAPTTPVAPSLTPEQEAVEAAREAYRGFIETTDRLIIAGDAAERPRDEVEAEIRQYAVGGAGNDAMNTVIFYSSEGITQEGEARIVSMEPIEVDLDPTDPRQEGIPQITLEVCVDLSQREQRLPDGTSIAEPGSPERVPSQPVLRLRQEGDLDGWYVERIDIEPGASC